MIRKIGNLICSPIRCREVGGRLVVKECPFCKRKHEHVGEGIHFAGCAKAFKYHMDRAYYLKRLDNE